MISFITSPVCPITDFQYTITKTLSPRYLSFLSSFFQVLQGGSPFSCKDLPWRSRQVFDFGPVPESLIITFDMSAKDSSIMPRYRPLPSWLSYPTLLSGKTLSYPFPRSPFMSPPWSSLVPCRSVSSGYRFCHPFKLSNLFKVMSLYSYQRDAFSKSFQRFYHRDGKISIRRHDGNIRIQPCGI